MKLDVFKGLDTDIEEHPLDWENLYNSKTPHLPEEEPWPGKWNNYDYFKKIIILRILRPDCVIPAFQHLISKEPQMGEKFIQPPAFNMRSSFNDSTCQTPIIFILSPGADPMTELKNLAETPGVKKTYVALSLGQGQAKKAIKEFNFARENKSWVVFQNCHLAPSFMPELEKLIDSIPEEERSDFRLWLTSMPSELFPVTVL